METANAIAVRSDLAPALAAWLSTKAAGTVTKYLFALREFAAFTGWSTGPEALDALMAGTRGNAKQALEAWKGSMLHKGLAPASINSRLAALRAFLTAADEYELVPWTVTVHDVAPEPRRDSRGPTWDEYERMLLAEPSVRNRAILLLMGDRGLRRSEVAGLMLADVRGREVLVLGKGRREKAALTITERTAAALDAWIAERGKRAGTLFEIDVDHIYSIVQRAGRRVGVVARPHGLRHTFGTRAAKASNGDSYLVQALLRHADPRTSAAYVDTTREDADALLNAMVVAA